MNGTWSDVWLAFGSLQPTWCNKSFINGLSKVFSATPEPRHPLTAKICAVSSGVFLVVFPYAPTTFIDLVLGYCCLKFIKINDGIMVVG